MLPVRLTDFDISLNIVIQTFNFVFKHKHEHLIGCCLKQKQTYKYISSI
jgi:hypothetical protein